ncbi:unnamed protein product, partial [marine sediment metagenome]
GVGGGEGVGVGVGAGGAGAGGGVGSGSALQPITDATGNKTSRATVHRITSFLICDTSYKDWFLYKLTIYF